MRKIFLTSGLVVCMACPAFANLNADGTIAGTGNPNAETPVAADPATCQYPTLLGYDGTSTFTAQWGKNWYEITVDSNLGSTTITGGSTAAAPTKLYTMKGQSGVYQTRTGDSDANYAFTDWVAGNGDVLTTDPTGITVNYTLNDVIPAGRSQADFTTAASSVEAQRAFLGFFNSASGSDQYIDASGNLTPLGASTASAASEDTTWYAQWSTVHPTVTNPVLPGYTFQGWSDTSGGAVISDFANHKIGQNTNLYAIWQANNIKVKFNCARPQAGANIPGTQNTYAVNATGALSSDPVDHEIAMDGSDYLTEECTLQGWTFVGWNCASGLTTDSAATLAVVDITKAQLETTSGNNTGYQVFMKSSSDVTCTAVWTQNEIGLTWKDGTTASGGNTITVGTESESCDYDGGITLPDAPSRAGYTFEGWSVSNTAAN